ncbi:MAG TPA: biotin/lipoyl-containing protein [Armatimonadota bacterium]|jgi:acetyl-CoA carboxylase biotin carboxyl carrier protein
MNLDRISALLSELSPSTVAEMEVEEPGFSLKVRRARLPASAPLPAALAGADGAEAALAAEPRLHWVESSLVGIYRAADPPLLLGDRVAEGEVVGVVESMGIPNTVRAEHAGVVEEVAIADGDPVEYGQPLLGLRTD